MRWGLPHRLLHDPLHEAIAWNRPRNVHFGFADPTVPSLVDAEVTFTHAVADGMHGAIVRARKPGEA